MGVTVRCIRRCAIYPVVIVVLLVSGACGEHVVTAVPSSDRLLWASELGRADAVSDPVLVRRITTMARASGARALQITLLSVGGRRAIPVVTLQASDPASYMKHGLPEFLRQIGYFDRNDLAFVELLDQDGNFAWSAGRFPSGGMVHAREDLDQCSPIYHSQLVARRPPPCPAD